MAELHKKIRITDSATDSSSDSAADFASATGNHFKQQATGAAPDANTSTPAGLPRRSPVTDLLFDRPRSTDSGQQSESAGSSERQRPIYYISIVAEMVETHPQTLRMYERMGLLNPQRTSHNVRLYSEDDVDQVRRIQHLTQDLGVNLAGVEVVFKLLREMRQLREELEQEIADASQAAEQ